MAGVELFGDWKKAKAICGSMEERWKRAANKAVLQEAHFLRGKIVKGISEQAPGGEAFKPLSPLTLAVRAFIGFKGSKALIVRGDLRNGIVAKSLPDFGSAFVGILRTAKSKTGKPLVNVAMLEEYGSGPIVVPITPKSQKFYHAALARAGIVLPKGGHASGGLTIAIMRIPPRPFMGPVFNKFGTPEQIRSRFFHSVVESLAGDLGT
jgi:hypothetical protein